MIIKADQLPPPARPPIPRRFHQIWLGNAPIPADHLSWAAALREMHPGWDYWLWRDSDLAGVLAERPELRELYYAWDNPGYRSDILRLLILHQHGGVYLDTDVEVFNPLPDILLSLGAFIGATFSPQPFGEVLIENAVIASAPRHPWLSLCLARLPGSIRAIPGHSPVIQVLNMTGPGFLSRVLMEYRAQEGSIGKDVTVLPAALLYPTPPDGQWPIPSEALARHHWRGSWL